LQSVGLLPVFGGRNNEQITQKNRYIQAEKQQMVQTTIKQKIRKTDIPSGGAFRRVANSYDICDYARLAGPEEVEKATRK